MAETSREGGDSPSESGIPSGLNRIRTRRVPSKDRLISKSDDLDAETIVEPQMAAPGSGNVFPRPRSKQQMAEGRHLKITDRKEGFRKGKKIARWFTSYLSKDSNQDFDDILPSSMVSNSEVKSFDKNVSAVTKKHGKQKQSTGKRSSPERIQKKKVPKGVKSFSHELGPKGGIRPSHPRAHSYNDLKELIGSLKSRFDSAKEVVNAELANFSVDVMDVLEGNDGFYSEEQEMEENLLILAQQCAEMTSSEFRDRCEGIVQDLADKRQRCQTEVLKQLFTRMLFILTRCTRLLQFDKDSVPIDENSLHKFKQCLERIPAVEMSWLPKPGIDDSGSVSSLNQRHDYQHLRALEEPLSESDATCQKESTVLAQKSTFQNLQDFCSSESSITGSDFQSASAAQRKKTLSSYQENVLQTRNLMHKDACSSLHEQERTSDVSDSVICRICEEIVPASCLESHSYICAFADKCDFAYSDVDERLLKLAEVLDQIIDSCSLNFHASQNSPEISRTQFTNSAVGSGGQSPKASEWQTRGLEGLFEDIHEMDTACIDDSYLSTSGNMKGHFGIKLGHYGAPSSTGSLTSVSSTNTPRASHFGVFWLEHNNYSEPEDIQQMTDLGDIARCVANTDIAKEGASEYLLACMQDLQDILQHSKLKALVIDTFGSRIENLLREKYLLACELMDNRSPKSESKSKEGIGCLVDSPSQSSTMSTPLHPAHKERTTIDDFEIIKPISRGAFGKVFLARKRTTGDLFAIKVLKKLDMIRKNDIERILAERNILITVRNPFVVRFFYSFTCRDNLYLVMEYLNGGDLYSLLRKVGCLEEDVARIYIAELVLALEYLHSLGIVHRDLKPDNILIAHDGHIKLTDFGLSKIGLINSTVDLSGSEINGATPSDDHDQHGSFNSAHQTDERSQRSAVGTPDYLAPEILLGTEHGYAADWWSVGIILFELITGIPPFNAERPEIIFDNILNRKIPWPPVPNDMSYQAQDLINRFLVHNPDQRLGANGSSEVKAHPFFAGVNWDTLALQKVAFIPNPDSADDTSYFMSRYSQISIGIPEDQNCSESASDTASCSNSGIEMDECGDMAEFDSCPLNLSLINFSFKNLSQLASINYDVLLQSGKDPSKCSSPSKGPDS